MWDGHVVLLAGGVANRMLPLSQYIPKCLLPLRDRPLIIRYLEKLEYLGVRRVTLVLEPMLGSMIELAINRGYSGKIWLKFLYQDRCKGKGPGYALSLCKDYVVGSPLLVFLPDEWRPNEQFSFTVINDPESLGEHPIAAALAVAKFSREELTAIGNVEFNPETRIISSYLNKPSIDEVISPWGTCGGWAFFDTTRLFDYLDELVMEAVQRNTELHMAVVIQKLIERGMQCAAFEEEDGPQIHFTDITRFWGLGPTVSDGHS